MVKYNYKYLIKTFLPERFQEICRVIERRGEKFILVEFKRDKYQAVVPRRAIRRMR